MAKKSKQNTRQSKSSNQLSNFLSTTKKTVSESASFVSKKAKEAAEAMHFGESSGFESLRKLFEHELQDLYSAEQQLTAALPKMAKKANSQKLSKGFTQHLKETEEHIKRLEKIAKDLKFDISGKTCKAMKGLIQEGQEVIDSKGPPALIDTALIAAAQRVEHYEMAGYGCVRTMAEALGLSSAAKTLQATLDEEGETDKKLTKIAEGEILSKIRETGASRSVKR